VLAQQLAVVARQYPTQRAIVLRLLEPLGAPEEPRTDARPDTARRRSAVALDLAGVVVRAGGHTILDEIDLHIGAGSDVAIVGASGAGKSSLVGVLLGWHRPVAGEVRIDGEPLDGATQDRLRRETAWVDPAVQLWNRSLLDNLCYGAPTVESERVGAAVDAAALQSVLERLPDGLQTRLGEGGALVSGGEGQRVRLGRALLRPNVRLVILDEPFRGLDREHRRRLLHNAREAWADATFLCITHDVGETLGFSRVLVLQAGRIVEDGDPAVLSRDLSSRYAALLRDEDDVRDRMWRDEGWRRLWMRDGSLEQETTAT
jgi:ATP-binding cassette subfamily B protein